VGRGVKLYYLDYVLNSKSETTDRRWWGWRRSCRSVVSVRSTLAHEVKVETVAARVGLSIRVALLMQNCPPAVKQESSKRGQATRYETSFIEKT
jgi:hypothetical protein